MVPAFAGMTTRFRGNDNFAFAGMTTRFRGNDRLNKSTNLSVLAKQNNQSENYYANREYLYAKK